MIKNYYSGQIAKLAEELENAKRAQRRGIAPQRVRDAKETLGHMGHALNNARERVEIDVSRGNQLCYFFCIVFSPA